MVPNPYKIIFITGAAPIIRTVKYLEMGKIVFRDNVKIFSVNYNQKGKHHEGLRDFVFWNLPQVQYKNPNVQCITFQGMTPTPFIRIFLDSGKSILVDVDSRKREEIIDHLQDFTAICKKESELIKNAEKSETKPHVSLFGFGCERHCICEVLGQVPCPRLVKLPNAWRALKDPYKFRIPPCFMEPGLAEEEEENNE